MDGYAIRHADLPGPWSVTGESAAGGEGAPKVNAREAVRIFTGAAMPEGADCVLIQEDAESRNGTLILTGSGPDRPGKHVRAQGSDFIKRSEEHTSELQSLMRISYAVFCLKKK